MVRGGESCDEIHKEPVTQRGQRKRLRHSYEGTGTESVGNGGWESSQSTTDERIKQTL